MRLGVGTIDDGRHGFAGQTLQQVHDRLGIVPRQLIEQTEQHGHSVLIAGSGQSETDAQTDMGIAVAEELAHAGHHIGRLSATQSGGGGGAFDGRFIGQTLDQGQLRFAVTHRQLRQHLMDLLGNALVFGGGQIVE